MISINMNHWLMKSEPEVFSIEDLKSRNRALWDGVRNYQARNLMRDQMQVGDLVLFYHSNAEPPGVAGIAKVSATAQVDPTQFDPMSKYFDPKASKSTPRWVCVEVAFESQLPSFVSLSEIRKTRALKDMLLLRPGQRLSIQPVSKVEFETIVKMANQNHD